MTFTFGFLQSFISIIGQVAPLLGLLLTMISGISLYIGRRERWSWIDSVYFGFVTATTVGYGDLRPTRRGTKLLAIVIAFLGLLLSGIIVAAAVAAATYAYEQHSVRG